MYIYMLFSVNLLQEEYAGGEDVGTLEVERRRQWCGGEDAHSLGAVDGDVVGFVHGGGCRAR